MFNEMLKSQISNLNLNAQSGFKPIYPIVHHTRDL